MAICVSIPRNTYKHHLLTLTSSKYRDCFTPPRVRLRRPLYSTDRAECRHPSRPRGLRLSVSFCLSALGPSLQLHSAPPAWSHRNSWRCEAYLPLCYSVARRWSLPRNLVGTSSATMCAAQASQTTGATLEPRQQAAQTNDEYLNTHEGTATVDEVGETAATTAAGHGQQQHQPQRKKVTEFKSKSKHQQRNSKPRLLKLDDIDDIDELFESVHDNEEELVAKLMQQLQGLSHKQQRLYGIWDGSSDGGRRSFIEQWRRRHADRRAMVAALQDPQWPPSERMSLRTSYIIKWRKVLFSCPHCWLLPGLCVCDRMQLFAPQRTHVVVYAHHGEWGAASNSGSILKSSLEGSEILLYRHLDHDTRMRDILNDTSRTTALLWPGADSLLPEQLKDLAEEHTGGRITIVALDATWGNARRMQGWFPKGTLTVRLPPESTLKDNKTSLLRPVRCYRGDLECGRVSTVEAVASLLYELEGNEAMYRGLLDNLKIKVDACRLQKNRTLVYDTQVPATPSSRRRWRGTDGTEAGQDDDGLGELRNGNSSEG